MKDRESRGYGEQWRKLRLLVLAEEPLCTMPGCPGAFSTQVHHKDHNTRNNARDNLAGCCAPCHSRYHATHAR
jgi:5-methylcytosine-specific restriction protein A